MDRDWERFKRGGTGQGGGSGTSLSEWYRLQIEEMRASDDFAMAQDTHHNVQLARLHGGAPPPQDGGGQKTPWEGLKELGFNITEIMGQERSAAAEARKEAEEAKTALFAAESQRLEEKIEGLRGEIRSGGTGGNVCGVGDKPKTLWEKVDEATEGKLVKRFAAVFLGEGNENGKGGRPEDPEEIVLRRMETGDRIKEKLGLTLGVGKTAALGNGHGFNAELVKLLLEDERETLRIRQEDARETRKVRMLEDMRDVVKENLPDAIGAARDFARRSNQAATAGVSTETAAAPKEGKGETSAPGKGSQMARAFVIECAACHKEFGVPERPEHGQHFTCCHCGQKDLEVEVP